MISTPEPAADVAERERQAGALARAFGDDRDSCPWSSGLTRRWWLEGYDGTEPQLNKAFEPGRPLGG